jgi:putative membrane protein
MLGHDRGMYHYMDDGSGYAWWWMLPMMLVFIAAIGAVVWAIVVGSRAHAPQVPQPPTPEQVLAHRLANGDVDAADYRERLAALRQSDT